MYVSNVRSECIRRTFGVYRTSQTYLRSVYIRLKRIKTRVRLKRTFASIRTCTCTCTRCGAESRDIR